MFLLLGITAHNEIVNIVRASYVQYQTRTDALARNVVRKIGSVEDVWAEHVWPLIRSKISITLQAAQDNVVHRHRSFEFLGKYLACATNKIDLLFLFTDISILHLQVTM